MILGLEDDEGRLTRLISRWMILIEKILKVDELVVRVRVDD